MVLIRHLNSNVVKTIATHLSICPRDTLQSEKFIAMLLLYRYIFISLFAMPGAVAYILRQQALAEYIFSTTFHIFSPNR